LQLSTAYYQYNIDSKFKGGEKILEAMGYRVVKDGGKPHYQIFTMEYKGNLSELSIRKKVAKLVVDLVLFDLELTTILQCIQQHNQKYPKLPCTIIDALEARKRTQGGVVKAMEHLRHITSSSGTESGDYGTPLSSFTKNTNTTHEQAHGHKDNLFPRIDPAKDLPPPDIDDPSVNFTSVMPHTNPSSDFDDDKLIPESTHLGYRNPPETKHNPLAGHGPTADLQTTTGGFVPNYSPQIAASTCTKYPSPMVASSHERDKFTGQRSGVSRYDRRKQPPYEMQDDLSQGVTQSYYLRSTSQVSGDGLRSLPTNNSIGSTTGKTTTRNLASIDNQLTATGGTYVRQKSMPFVPSNDETNITFTTSPPIAPVNSMTTNTSNTCTPVVYGHVPLCEPVSNTTTIDREPTATTTTASTAPKHGKLDLANLRKKTKEVTANFNIQVPDPPPQREKPDIVILKDHLDKKRATVEGINVKSAPSSNNYINYDELSQQMPKPKPMDRNPLNKRPAPTPRSSKESTSNPAVAQIESLNPSGEHVEYWQCAVCVMVNEAKHNNCKKCQSNRGYLSVSNAYCSFCNLLVFISEQKLHATSTCPMCQEKLVVYSVI